MKTIRADLAASHVVIMAIDETGAERAHVIADDGGASFSQLRAALEAAAGDVSPRASAGAPAVEVIEEPIEFDDPIVEADGSWVSDAARLLGDAKTAIETDPEAGAAWAQALGFLRGMSAPRGGK